MSAYVEIRKVARTILLNFSKSHVQNGRLKNQLGKIFLPVASSPSSPALFPTNTFVKAGRERDVKAGFSSCPVELVINAELWARTGSGST